jgi:hypothetical protein
VVCDTDGGHTGVTDLMGTDCFSPTLIYRYIDRSLKLQLTQFGTRQLWGKSTRTRHFLQQLKHLKGGPTACFWTFTPAFPRHRCRDSSVVRRWDTSWMIGGSSRGRGWEFFSSPSCPDWLWCSPNLLSNGYQRLFPWSKAAGA